MNTDGAAVIWMLVCACLLTFASASLFLSGDPGSGSFMALLAAISTYLWITTIPKEK